MTSQFVLRTHGDNRNARSAARRLNVRPPRGRADFDAPENDYQLENPGEVLLELIEARTASYCGEHDIIRIEDN
ncbi:MAG: hypothetical protein QOD89_443 [Bradyrhizobium sp.]|jgi:hypothetical protein|nr:hypothetical protein [Bradyrhizobium sp.]